ncbi:MAG: hypothetical protein MUO64_13855 [Anaerolineales bacterium]|nr:hypothetical protein [Anaerolineales bacterium]
MKYSLPYSDVINLSDQERQRYLDEGAPFEFSQTLEDLIGGQIDAGFLISGFYEDQDPDILDRRDYAPVHCHPGG